MTLVEQLDTLGSLTEHWTLPFSANIPSCLELDAIRALPEDLSASGSVSPFLYSMNVDRGTSLCEALWGQGGGTMNEKNQLSQLEGVANIDVILVSVCLCM